MMVTMEMMGKIAVVVFGIAMLLIGFMFGIETSVNKPKTNDKPKLDKLNDAEIAMLFMAVGFELERRGIAERLDRNPFDDLEKK